MLFVIVQPALILLFMFATIYCSKTKNEKAKKTWRRITWGTLVFWAVFIAVLIGKPLLFDPVVCEDIKMGLGMEKDGCLYHRYPDMHTDTTDNN